MQLIAVSAMGSSLEQAVDCSADKLENTITHNLGGGPYCLPRILLILKRFLASALKAGCRNRTREAF
jgi:hypothetical protein